MHYLYNYKLETHIYLNEIDMLGMSLLYHEVEVSFLKNTRQIMTEP